MEIELNSHELSASNEEKEIQNTRERRLENARIGYQVAVNLWGINNQGHWNRMSSLVIINSIFISAIGIILKIDWDNVGLTLLFIVIISAVGLISTYLWYQLMRKDFKDIYYYIRSARELEKDYIYPVKTIQNYKSSVYEFKEKGPYQVENYELENADDSQTDFFGFEWIKCKKTKCIIVQIIAMFAFIYFVLIFISLAIGILRLIGVMTLGG